MWIGAVRWNCYSLTAASPPPPNCFSFDISSTCIAFRVVARIAQSHSAAFFHFLFLLLSDIFSFFFPALCVFILCLSSRADVIPKVWNVPGSGVLVTVFVLSQSSST